MDIATYCSLLPKVELHAHLNGSLSMEVLEKLHNLKLQENPEDVSAQSIVLTDFKIDNGKSRNLSQCFGLFHIAQSLTDTPHAVNLATLWTLEEFAADNVIYLELRSTPRENENMTKTQYVQAMVDAVIESKSLISMKTGIIVSIDRRHSKEQAVKTVLVAIEMNRKHPDIVLGLDLSGDPNINSFNDFADILATGRNAGLKITVHTAEVENNAETKAILEWAPDRIGHATCIPDSLWNQLLQSKIPAEICLTSNVKCEVVESYDQHHFKKLYEVDYPLSLATDDKGVFTTSLTEEYTICAKTFKLTKEQLYSMALKSCEYIFSNDAVKQSLRDACQVWKRENTILS